MAWERDVVGAADESGLSAVIERLERGSSALHRLVQEPQEAVGHQPPATDGTGAVRVAFATDGLPDRIEVDPDWRRTVGSQGLAAAVTEACQGASQSWRQAVGEAAEAAGWTQRVNDVLAYLTGDGPPSPDVARASRPAPAPPPATTRSMSDILDDLSRAAASIGSLDDALRRAEEEPSGTGAFGHVTLTFTDVGTVRCAIDADWAGRQDADALSETLTQAAASLRAQRDGAGQAGMSTLAAQAKLAGDIEAYLRT